MEKSQGQAGGLLGSLLGGVLAEVGAQVQAQASPMQGPSESIEDSEAQGQCALYIGQVAEAVASVSSSPFLPAKLREALPVLVLLLSEFDKRLHDLETRRPCEECIDPPALGGTD